MKRAVIYFSLSNNTKDVAEKIAALCEADIYRMEMVKSLPEKFSKQIMIGGMQSTFGMKPKIKGLPEDITSYDEIILGTPIWAGKCASPVNSVLANSELCKKIVAVFTFSGGGDNAKCERQLRGKLPNVKHIIALADRQNDLSKNNSAKVEEFIGNLKA